MERIGDLLGYLIIGGLLFIVSIMNVEKLVYFDFSNFYVLLYFLYFLSSFIFFIFFKKKLSNNFDYIISFLFFFLFLIIPGILLNHYFLLEHLGEKNLYLRGYGKVAMFYFALTLIISPLLKFTDNALLKKNLVLIRKVFGMLSFVFFLKHGLEYFALEYIFQTKYHLLDISYLDYVLDNLIIRYDALTGVIVGILMLMLGLTSNKFSVRFLGKKWKKVQSLVFPAFLITVIHIAFSSRLDGFYIFLILLVVMFRIAAFLKKDEKTEKKLPSKSKKIVGYRCIPCGYIYDENEGDSDSGIAPGTKFEDIPDDWRCPVCGVTKDDFEAIYEEKIDFLEAEIIGYTMLTIDVLELKLKINNINRVDVKPGQFVNINYGDFNRSYSVVKAEKNILTFIIKLKENGKGSSVLKNKKIGDKLNYVGVFGKFILRNNENPKVFIATGTGVSPIINMITSNLKGDKNFLLFGVSYSKDLFYIEKIKKIKNLDLKVFISIEEIEGYEFGRIDLSKYNFPLNTDFYICGNPLMVKSNIDFLEKAGYTNIFSEKF